MPTCRDIITRAFRKRKVYSPGEDPTSEDMSDGLVELQSLYESWAANGMFGRLADVQTDGNYTASAGERIRATNSPTITIPTEFEDEGAAYPPYDMAFIEVVDVDEQEVRRYLYEAGTWVEINGLTLDSEAPLAGKGQAGLEACLALQMEGWGGEIGPATMRQASAFKMGLSLKLGGDAQRTAPDYF
jgi:hypothetical protein